MGVYIYTLVAVRGLIKLPAVNCVKHKFFIIFHILQYCSHFKKITKMTFLYSYKVLVCVCIRNHTSFGGLHAVINVGIISYSYMVMKQNLLHTNNKERRHHHPQASRHYKIC